MWTGHPLTIHICAVQFVHKRGTHTTPLAQRPIRLQNCIIIFVRLKEVWSSDVPCLILGCCLTCLSPRTHHLPHSLFFLPLHKNTNYNRYNMINSENTPNILHISKITQSTCCTIKNHSCVKTYRVAETSAPPLPQVNEPKELATVSKDRSLFWRSVSVI